MSTEREHMTRAVYVAQAQLLVEQRITALQVELAELRMVAGRLAECYASEMAAADVAALLAQIPGVSFTSE